ncbi:imidazole glycerol phosphate synthase subunit HisH [Eudoraea chungangensis]|uniref:imidazole glycerol phosphate synthase subunit HisH n=1 Tax=Eudoraea chungangensis TaxID=1481905 RepID=UPI0023EBBCFA|nr:imidazole glycerol phosphate synthase subunit HisH [Eudoraea chungangensis]
MTTVIIDYGAGNIQSIKFAFERLGITPKLTKDWEEISSSDRVIFPGVGEASSAMRKLKASKLDTLVPTLKQPVLGICLGMQLMCNSSEEGSTKGLGIFDTEVVRFTNKVKVPQIGWNQITDLKSGLFHNINELDYIYLVHSYYAPISDYTIATSSYELPYSSALRKNNFFGVQFHPEKSSTTGEQILKNFIEMNPYDAYSN